MLQVRKQVTVPKMYLILGNGVIVGLLGYIRINNLRFIKRLNSSSPTSSTNLLNWLGDLFDQIHP